MTEQLVLDQDHDEQIAELLMGRRIVLADLAKRLIWLDNGTEVEVQPNDGGCSCSSGDYELTHLATVDNIITDVRVVNDPQGDSYSGKGYSIFVFAGATEINAVQVDGDDGNGYYGTGYRLLVRPNQAPIIREEP